jgi:hypothetical protein
LKIGHKQKKQGNTRNGRQANTCTPDTRMKCIHLFASLNSWSIQVLHILDPRVSRGIAVTKLRTLAKYDDRSQGTLKAESRPATKLV